MRSDWFFLVLVTFLTLQSGDKDQQESRAVAEKPHDAVVKFDMYQNLQRHRVVLPAIARHLVIVNGALHYLSINGSWMSVCGRYFVTIPLFSCFVCLINVRIRKQLPTNYGPLVSITALCTTAWQ